jgi:DNA-binding transcriptional LysR family regulator
MAVNFELYNVFYVAANCGSLTKAAKNLFISQPALSQSIKQLEEQLGGRLFVRSSKGMTLTYEGKIMYEYVKQALLLLEIAENKFSQLKELAIGEINIGAGDSISKYFLMDYMVKFLEQYPKIKINVKNRTSDKTLLLLKQGKIDMGFVNLPIDDNNVEIMPVKEITDCFICGKTLFNKISGGKLVPEDISKYPLVMLENKTTSRQFVNEAFDTFGVRLEPVMELCSIDLIIDAVKKGAGIGCITREYAEKDFNKGEIYEVPTAFTLPRRSLAIITMKGAPLNFASYKFVDLIMNSKR